MQTVPRQNISPIRIRSELRRRQLDQQYRRTSAECADAEFCFDFDPFPHPRPEGFDGLTVEWGQSNYVNPPFKGPTAIVRKAIAENAKGKRVVFVFPIDKWVLMLLEAGATVRNLKDVKWHAIEDGSQGKGTGRHIAAFILEPKDVAT